jgi:hypothetical protein
MGQRLDMANRDDYAILVVEDLDGEGNVFAVFAC